MCEGVCHPVADYVCAVAWCRDEGAVWGAADADRMQCLHVATALLCALPRCDVLTARLAHGLTHAPAASSSIHAYASAALAVAVRVFAGAEGAACVSEFVCAHVGEWASGLLCADAPAAPADTPPPSSMCVSLLACYPSSVPALLASLTDGVTGPSPAGPLTLAHALVLCEGVRGVLAPHAASLAALAAAAGGVVGRADAAGVTATALRAQLSTYH